jgi:hypothetical protein
MIAVVVAVIVAVTGNDGGDPVLATRSPTTKEPATQAPSSAPTTKVIGSDRFKRLFVILTPAIAGNETSFLRDPETAQSMALEWLADKDPAQLNFKLTPGYF